MNFYSSSYSVSKHCFSLLISAICFVAVSIGNAGEIHAGEINVAVASNFINPVKAITNEFTATTSHVVNLSSGSTGKLYTQISNGAPYDILLAANAEEPVRLEQQGLGIPGTRFTYALGKLVVWSADGQRIGTDCENVLRKNDYTKLAIANPDTAPYGKQAVNALKHLGLFPGIEGKLIIGSNIGHAFQFVASRNVELGIVSLSQVIDPNNRVKGSYCLIPASLYQPLTQQAVLLQHGRDNAAAREFLDFLRSAKAHEIILGYGYDLGEN